MTRLVGITACSKSKKGEGIDQTFPARELYDSWLFDGRVAALEAHCDEWCIFSAEHGYVAPNDELGYYDTRIDELTEDEQLARALSVITKMGLADRVCILMGRDYAEPLKHWLSPTIEVWDPLEGVGLFEQRAALDALADGNLDHEDVTPPPWASEHPCQRCGQETSAKTLTGEFLCEGCQEVRAEQDTTRDASQSGLDGWS